MIDKQLMELIGHQIGLDRLLPTETSGGQNVQDTLTYLDALLANIPEHLFWKATDGRYLGCNQHFANFLGLSHRLEIANLTDFDLANKLAWSDRIREMLHDDEQKAIKTSQTQKNEIPLFGGNGQTVLFTTKTIPVKNSQGDILGLIIAADDVTHRRQGEVDFIRAKEKAETANQAKSDFLANMSHDLRTPLNNVLGMTELLQLQKHLPEQKDLFSGILTAGRSLLHLVEEIMNFSKLDSDNYTPEEVPFDLRELLEEITGLLSREATKKQIDLIVSYPDEVPHFIFSDAMALRQFLFNLASNAVKFTESGHVLIAVELEKDNKDTATLKFTVEDTGIGIASDKIEHIFDRFYRGTLSYKGGPRGAGLGLAIVKKVVDNLGGDISVNSTLGTGSTFIATLPLKLQSTSQIRSDWLQKYFNVNVLIIDDHAIRSNVLIKQLSSTSNRSCSSQNASEIITERNNAGEPFQIVIIDEDILVDSPCDLLERLKAMPETGRTLFLLSTSSEGIEKLEIIQSQGFFDKLQKPIKPTKFTEQLTNHWENWQKYWEELSDKPKDGPMKILLVEDDIVTQKVSKTILEQIGCEVDIAPDCSTAMSLFGPNYDLIFMDLGLEEEDGITITKKIRALEDGKTCVPIFALTAHASKDDVKRCFESGMNGFLSKPVSIDDFQDVIAQLG